MLAISQDQLYIVMSYTFTLTGRETNILSVNYSPPIEIDANYAYSLALIGLHTYHSIPNIDDKENKFYYRDVNGEKNIVIPVGWYEISDIEKYLQEHLKEEYNYEAKIESLLSLKPNNNTLKCELKVNLR